MSTMTVTIDTGQWVYIDKGGLPHTVTNGETFTMTLTAIGDGATYSPDAGQSVACTDGTKLFFDTDAKHSHLRPLADAASLTQQLGELVIFDPVTNERTAWKCTALDMDTANAPAKFTTASFEQVGNNAHTFTWADIDVSTA